MPVFLENLEELFIELLVRLGLGKIPLGNAVQQWEIGSRILGSCGFAGFGCETLSSTGEGGGPGDLQKLYQIRRRRKRGLECDVYRGRSCNVV